MKHVHVQLYIISLSQAPLTVRAAAAAAGLAAANSPAPPSTTATTTIGVPQLLRAPMSRPPGPGPQASAAAAGGVPPQLPQQPLMRQTLPHSAMQAAAVTVATTIGGGGGGARMPATVAAMASGHTIQHRHLTTNRAGKKNAHVIWVYYLAGNASTYVPPMYGSFKSHQKHFSSALKTLQI